MDSKVNFEREYLATWIEEKIHNHCMITRGVIVFQCKICGRGNSQNYSNGIEVCDKCCTQLNICKICGKSFDNV